MLRRGAFSPTIVAYDAPRSTVWRLNRWPLQGFRGEPLPLIAKSLPDFGAMFEHSAAGLKIAADAAMPA